YNSFQMSVDWKSRFKKTFKTRLVIAGLIFTVVGWFLLGVMLFGRFFEEELLEIEDKKAGNFDILSFIKKVVTSFSFLKVLLTSPLKYNNLNIGLKLN
ncbi:unnamed protein product, partial [marine sediment metagenome]